MRKMEHKEKLYGRVLEAFRDRGFKPLPDTKFDINTIRYSDQNGTTHTLALENFYKMFEGGDDFEKVFQRVLVGHDRSESLPYVDLIHFNFIRTIASKVLNQFVLSNIWDTFYMRLKSALLVEAS